MIRSEKTAENGNQFPETNFVLPETYFAKVVSPSPVFVYFGFRLNSRMVRRFNFLTHSAQTIAEESVSGTGKNPMSSMSSRF
jgi:hypothetical protein